MATNAQVESLKQALSYDRPPLCSGTVSPPPEGFYLYYGKEDPRFINFASSTPEQLDRLAAACSPATFGLGNQDVYDESYRKALKMDAADFAVQFDPTVSNLVKTIEENLLQGETEKMTIRPEIYKLNVYGKDSFFKAHKDTPRGADMLGSLVIVYPTAHQGGELVLRHKGREWKFDAKALTSLQSSPSLAYIAFYSDIEHEVLKVTDGSRVTLTYNLYLVPQGPTAKFSRAPNPPAASVKPNLKDTTNFQATLQQLLKSPAFMHEGGTLALNLTHLYPVGFNTRLEDVTAYLKGEDAHVYRMCRELKLQPILQMIYFERSTSRYLPREAPRLGVMVEAIIENRDYNPEGSSYERSLVEEYGGVPVNLQNDILATSSDYWNGDNPKEEYEQLTWLTDFAKSTNELRDVELRYGNEHSLGYIYCSPCLIIRIDPASDRT